MLAAWRSSPTGRDSYEGLARSGAATSAQSHLHPRRPHLALMKGRPVRGGDDPPGLGTTRQWMP